MKVLIIDNYDSFTYNLLHYVEQFAATVDVVRNDAIAIEDTESYSHFVLSPGPGLPKDAGISMEIISKYYQTRPVLGVCLGCQAIAEFFGASLYNQRSVAHGIARMVKKTGNPSSLLEGMPETFKVGLYHSWAIDKNTLPDDLKVTATFNDIVMAIEHEKYPIAGVQFHPESIMTENGISIIHKWLSNS